VAFAGWRPTGDGTRDRLLVCDPGDNALEGRPLHGWDAKPREIPIYFGTRRPNVVLLPAGSFTVHGAVLIRPTSEATDNAPRKEEATADGMPDLSQDINPAWVGLCGSTSGANVLYCMAQRKSGVLPDFPRGPSAVADEGVVRLLTGQPTEVLPRSLAGRMGTSQAGYGATNAGMREGMESWLNEHDSGSWTVTLDWFDDAEKPREQQRDFFGRLADAVRNGGGAILCLWPGTEFSNAPVAESDSAQSSGDADADGETPSAQQPTNKSPPGRPRSPQPRPEGDLPDDSFPAVPPASATPRPALPGRTGSGPSPKEAVAQAQQQINEARRQLTRNEPTQAFEHATRAVAVLHEHGGDDADSAKTLADALALCKEIEPRLPKPARDSSERRTLFQ
jgi:hypothetical protein